MKVHVTSNTPMMHVYDISIYTGSEVVVKVKDFVQMEDNKGHDNANIFQ